MLPVTRFIYIASDNHPMVKSVRLTNDEIDFIRALMIENRDGRSTDLVKNEEKLHNSLWDKLR